MNNKPLLVHKLGKGDERLQEAFNIRRKVFVQEQNVPEEEEYDDFEDEAQHFLAFFDQLPVATARWRKTKDGVKLERFAVLKPYRGRGVGSAIIQTVLEDVLANSAKESEIYLHAQLDAIPFYTGFNFKIVGERFSECNILHYKMVWVK